MRRDFPLTFVRKARILWVQTFPKEETAVFAMCRCNVNTAAAADTVGVSSCVKTSRQCADTNIAMTPHDALLASIFVALMRLLDPPCLPLTLGLLRLLSLI